MVLNIKNLFKKVCMLSAAATMAVGLGASFAGAAKPDGTKVGIKASDTTIGASEATLTQSITLATDLQYTGSAQNLVKDASITNAAPGSGVALYLRAVKGDDTSTTKTWTKVWENGTAVSNALSDSNLQGTQNGTYNVYYYIDGNGNYNDVKGAND